MKSGIAFFKLLIYSCIAIGCTVANISNAQPNHSLSDQLDAEIAYSNSVLLPSDNIDNKIQKNLFVKAVINKTSCFVGEPVLVTYLLYTRLNSQSKVATQPTFNGCTVYEITSADTLPQIAKQGSWLYKTYEIRKVVIVPLRAGRLTLDAAVVDNTIDFYSPLALKQNGAPDIHKQVLITSNKPTLEVLSLPKPTASGLFNGAIGNFSIRAAIAKRNDTVNSHNRLEITISGQGNFASVELPHIEWPTSIHHFEHATAVEVNTNEFPFTGKVVFSIPFSTSKAGSINIPPITFSFFDPTVSLYTTTQTAPIQMLVTQESVNVSPIPTAQENTIGPRKYIWIVPLLALVVLVAMLLRRTKQGQKEEQISNQIMPMPIGNVPSQIEPPLTSLQQLQEQIALLIQTPNIDDAWYKQAIAIAEKWQLLTPSVTAQSIIAQGNRALYAPFSENFHQSIVVLLIELKQ